MYIILYTPSGYWYNSSPRNPLLLPSTSTTIIYNHSKLLIMCNHFTQIPEINSQSHKQAFKSPSKPSLSSRSTFSALFHAESNTRVLCNIHNRDIKTLKASHIKGSRVLCFCCFYICGVCYRLNDI